MEDFTLFIPPLSEHGHVQNQKNNYAANVIYLLSNTYRYSVFIGLKFPYLISPDWHGGMADDPANPRVPSRT